MMMMMMMTMMIRIHFEVIDTSHVQRRQSPLYSPQYVSMSRIFFKKETPFVIN